MNSLQFNKLTIEHNSNPKALPNPETLTFGTTFTDHMLTIKWDEKVGWYPPKIHPYSPLALDPAAMVFHYGGECFEGLKAYKQSNGTIRLFRPLENMKRLNRSAERLNLPTFNNEELLKLIIELVKLDERFIPTLKGYSLYIRPTLIATQKCLGVTSTSEALLFVILSPVGPYYPTGFKAIQLLATNTYVRAWPGGTGDVKVGGNYSPGLKAQSLALQNQCQQILWLLEDQITEVGTMNFFLYLKLEDGITQLITPKLDGTILPGITRDSIIKLGLNEGIQVREISLTIQQFIQYYEKKQILEAFGTGTACIISPIKGILYNGKLYEIPLNPNQPNAQAGPLANLLFDKINRIQMGEIDSEWSITIN